MGSNDLYYKRRPIAREERRWRLQYDPHTAFQFDPPSTEIRYKFHLEFKYCYKFVFVLAQIHRCLKENKSEYFRPNNYAKYASYEHKFYALPFLTDALIAVGTPEDVDVDVRLPRLFICSYISSLRINTKASTAERHTA